MSKGPPTVKRFPTSKQRKMDALLDKNAEGVISPDERKVLTELVAEAEKLMVENSKALADFVRDHKPTTIPAGAVPVTVWVAAEQSRPS